MLTKTLPWVKTTPDKHAAGLNCSDPGSPWKDREGAWLGCCHQPWKRESGEVFGGDAGGLILTDLRDGQRQLDAPILQNPSKWGSFLSRGLHLAPFSCLVWGSDEVLHSLSHSLDKPQSHTTLQATNPRCFDQHEMEWTSVDVMESICCEQTRKRPADLIIPLLWRQAERPESSSSA